MNVIQGQMKYKMKLVVIYVTKQLTTKIMISPPLRPKLGNTYHHIMPAKLALMLEMLREKNILMA
jgi:hypothetical protein